MIRSYFSAALMVLGLWAAPVSAEEPFIIVQSTTSTQNSGLLDYILPGFEAESGIDVRVVAVGTGQAIRNAINGDGDVLLVHARPAEEQFVADGWGVERQDVMYNDFVLVGPPLTRPGFGVERTFWPRFRPFQRRRHRLHRAAMTAEHTRPSLAIGRPQASTRQRRPGHGTGKPVPAWAPR